MSCPCRVDPPAVSRHPQCGLRVPAHACSRADLRVLVRLAYGLACGLLAPALSSLLTGMPPAPILPGMICELGMYGFVTGFLSKRVRTGKPTLDVYCVLLPAMLLGRAVSGLLNGLVFRAGEYTMTMFLTASFVTALPGIAIQVLLIPVLLLALAKADLYAYAS